MRDICIKEQCTGCTACVSICSHNAVKMEKDECGFMYPIIDNDKCVNCGLCKKICPNNKEINLNSPRKCYVGHASDYMEEMTSVSGGIASVISRWVIRNGGTVYGCTSEDISHIRHIRVSDENCLYKLKGSKYVQSDLDGIFPLVKADLKNKLVVVFIGTPCQVSGLKQYLRKDYQNLITIDFVCHGVPSQQILIDELKQIVSVDDLINCKLAFRRKCTSNKKTVNMESLNSDSKFTYARSEFGIFLTNRNDKTVYQAVFPKNTYITGFLTGLFYRSSCYQCHYAKPERVSDITVGDFADNEKQFKHLSGGRRVLSMVTFNSEKSLELKKIIAGYLEISPVNYDVLIAHNNQLRGPMKKHPKYEEFKGRYAKEGYGIVKEILHKDIKRINKSLFVLKIKKILYRIPGCKKVVLMLKSKKLT